MVDFDAAIDQFLEVDRSGEHRGRRVGVYYASELGFPCLRSLFLRYRHPKKKLSKRTLRVFHLGNMIHDFVEDVFENSENSFVVDETEKRVAQVYRAGPKKFHFEIHGRVDAVIVNREVEHCDEPMAVEIKSCAPNMFKYGDLPKSSHVTQLMFYLKQLGLERGYVLYVEKYGLRTRSCLVKYDAEIYNQLVKRARQLHYALVKEKAPPRHESFPSKFPCSYCEVKEECKK